MKDLTVTSIPRLLVFNAVPVAIGMMAQTLYYLVDLLFVARLGDTELAGVSAAGNLIMISIALTQMVSVGTAACISHAVGRKSHHEVGEVFLSSMLVSLLMGILILGFGYLFGDKYLGLITSDVDVLMQGKTYLYWFLPSIALQLFISSLGSSLRGMGLFKPGAMVSILTVLINIVLAPVLIAGWGTGMPMGVAGAGLATTLSASVGLFVLMRKFPINNKFISLRQPFAKPSIRAVRRLLGIGIPAGGELIFFFLTMAVMFWGIREFGAGAQAGFGLGSRVLQAIFLPTLCIAYAATPVAAQNYGAQRYCRVTETFVWALIINCCVMAIFTLVCFLIPEALVSAFSADEKVVAVSAMYLKISSIGLLASGVVYVCSSMFQAIGNTWPALFSTSFYSAGLIVILIYFSGRPEFYIEQVWKAQLIMYFAQAILSLGLLRWQFMTKLGRSFNDGNQLPSGLER